MGNDKATMKRAYLMVVSQTQKIRKLWKSISGQHWSHITTDNTSLLVTDNDCSRNSQMVRSTVVFASL